MDILERSVRNMCAMWIHAATSCGGRAETWPDAVAVDSGAPNPVINRTTIASPSADPNSLFERAAEFYASRELPWGIVDPFDTFDFSSHGLERIARMPCMALEPSPSRAVPGADVEIVAVRDDAGLDDFKQVLFNGFTVVPWPTDRSALFGSRFYSQPNITPWVGYLDGEPVGCSVSAINDGIVGVYMVGVTPEARNRKIGEAMSWAATLADASLPAVLQSSPLGLPVYTRMGYQIFGHAPFWARF